ncbi:MAG TPA: hypothetical protein VK074_12965 [Fodinibius sp.]|nr:hypothetical protein [Fodinibius sp.]
MKKQNQVILKTGYSFLLFRLFGEPAGLRSPYLRMLGDKSFAASELDHFKDIPLLDFKKRPGEGQQQPKLLAANV